MRVGVVGATGLLGREVLPRLLEAGHAVRALRRSGGGAGALLAGVDWQPGDLFEPASLNRLLNGCDAALHLATSLRAEADGAVDWQRNDAVRRDGTRHLLAACTRGGVQRIVVQSVAFVSAPQGAGAWSTGTGPLIASAMLASAADMEAMVAAAAMARAASCLVLRGGWFYGAGTALHARWQKQAAQGAGLSFPGDGQDFVSLVHVADLASAFVAALTSPATGTLAVVDDEPVRWAELTAHASRLLGCAQLARGGRPGLGSFGVDSAAAKAALGWAPRYPNYRAGLAADLHADPPADRAADPPAV